MDIFHLKKTLISTSVNTFSFKYAQYTQPDVFDRINYNDILT